MTVTLLIDTGPILIVLGMTFFFLLGLLIGRWSVYIETLDAISRAFGW